MKTQRTTNNSNLTASDIKGLLALFSHDLDKINDLINIRISSEVDLIPEIASHLIAAGGKRLRSLITLAASSLCRYRGGDHIKLACAVELMHTATLLHDDVVDESDQRRGKPTARLIWGNQASVLVGDFLLGQAFQLMVETGNVEALRVLSQVAAVISEGEVMQLTTAHNLDTDIKKYLAVITSKTAALFAVAAEVGAILAGVDHTARQSLKNYGLNLGISFQLIDDVLDYSGANETLGKSVGDDLREGKVTLPLILAYRDACDQNLDDEKEFWQRLIVKSDCHEGDFAKALSYLQKHDSLNQSIDIARDYGQLAADQLNNFADSDYKRAMRRAVDFAIARAT